MLQERNYYYCYDYVEFFHSNFHVFMPQKISLLCIFKNKELKIFLYFFILSESILRFLTSFCILLFLYFSTRSACACCVYNLYSRKEETMKMFSIELKFFFFYFEKGVNSVHKKTAATESKKIDGLRWRVKKFSALLFSC